MSVTTGPVTGIPIFSVNPTILNFAKVSLGRAATLSVVVTNSGSATLSISSIQSTSSQFTVSPSNASLAPGANQTVYITFTPTLKNTTTTASIVFTHNASGSPSTVPVSGASGSGQIVGQVAVSSSISNLTAAPEEYAIAQNFPNPFNPTTTIAYYLPEASRVRLSVFNILGQEVATLVDGEVREGVQTLDWNASSNAGSALPSGLYFYRLHATSVWTGREFSDTKRMTLLK